MPGKPQIEMSPHVRPFARENTVDDAVSDRAVAASLMVPNDAVPLGTQTFDGALRRQIEVVGAEADDPA